MKYEIVGNTGVPPRIAILCPIIRVQEVINHYVDPYLKYLGEDIMICDLFIDSTKKKTSAADIKEYIADLLPNLKAEGIDTLIVTQPDYFKILTKKSKTEATLGDVLDTIDPDFKAAYCPNYGRIFYDPDKIRAKIKIGLEGVCRYIKGDTSSVGSNIVHFAEYLTDYSDILVWLDKLLEMDCDLTCDIEGFSLKHYDAGLGTITFCWNEHEGIAFAIDSNNNPFSGHKSGRSHNTDVRAALKDFFYKFKRKMIYHNISFDVYVLIYQLYMKDILDQEGLLYGLEILLRNWDCTQLITYLATNSCAGNELGLKVQAQAFAGNYAQDDIHDITIIALPDLLQYNLVDGLSTWYVYNKHRPTMIADQQENTYYKLFQPAIVDIIQMQLTGMPINMVKVVALEKKLQKESDDLFNKMENLQIVRSFMSELKDEMVIKKNAKLKTKQITKADLGKTKDTIVEFNPNSPTQLQRLLYSEDFLGLPVLDYTKSKQPTTGAETLEKLVNHTKDPEVLRFIEILVEFKASAIILSTFLPAFLKAKKGSDGWYYLFGNFRLGGTASGRLSSNGPK